MSCSRIPDYYVNIFLQFDAPNVTFQTYIYIVLS